MANFLESRLKPFVALTEDEKLLLSEISEPAKTFRPTTQVISGLACPSNTYVVTGGCAYEYRMLREGGRQIVRLLLSGDVFSAPMPRAPLSDFAALTECQVGVIQQRSLDRLLSSSRLRGAWLSALQLDAEALIQHIVCIGRKSALARAAHFLLEFYHRMEARGLAANCKFAFPLNQQEFGDVLGLSTVHTNRSLRQLEDMHLISYRYKSVKILNKTHLERVGEFSDVYLPPRVSSVPRFEQDRELIFGVDDLRRRLSPIEAFSHN